MMRMTWKSALLVTIGLVLVVGAIAMILMFISDRDAAPRSGSGHRPVVAGPGAPMGIDTFKH